MTSAPRHDGVDWRQWRALLRAYTLVDYAVLLGAHGRVAAHRQWRHALLVALLMMLLSVAQAAIVLLSADVPFAASVVVTMTCVIAMSGALFEGSGIVTPDDFAVIGFRPVSSRTYLVVRTSAAIVKALEQAVLTGVLPVLAFVVRPGGSWQIAVGAAAAMTFSAIGATLAVVAGYAWVVRVARPSRILRAVTALQLLGWIVLMGIYAIGLAQFADAPVPGREMTMRDLRMPESGGSLWLPPIWFAAFVPLAAGRFEPRFLLPAAASLAAIGVLLALVLGPLSALYVTRISAMQEDAGASRPRPPFAWTFLPDHWRAVLMLVQGQISGDMPTRMAMLTSLVMTWVYFGGFALFGGSGRSGASGGGFLSTFAPAVIVVFSTREFYRTLTTSAAPQAGWFFHTTPNTPASLVLVTRDVVAWIALGPSLLAVAVYLSYAHGSISSGLQLAAYAGLLAYINLQVAALMRPGLPFSLPNDAHSGRLLLTGFLSLLLIPPIVLGEFLLDHGPLAKLCALFVLTAVIIGLNRLTVERLSRDPGLISYIP